LVVSAWETAVTVTVAGFGTVLGAVYKPPVVIVPTVAFPPATPFTCQFTAIFVVPVTVAVNCCVWPGVKFTDAGETLTVITTGGGPLLPLPQEIRNGTSEAQAISKSPRRMDNPFEDWEFSQASTERSLPRQEPRVPYPKLE